MSLTHMLLLQAKPETSSAQFDAALASLLALKQQIPVVVSVEAHPSINPGGQSRYTHIVNFTFASVEDLKTYIQHPAHQAILGDFQRFFANPIVFDYLQDADQ